MWHYVLRYLETQHRGKGEHVQSLMWVTCPCACQTIHSSYKSQSQFGADNGWNKSQDEDICFQISLSLVWHIPLFWLFPPVLFTSIMQNVALDQFILFLVHFEMFTEQRYCELWI